MARRVDFFMLLWTLTFPLMRHSSKPLWMLNAHTSVIGNLRGHMFLWIVRLSSHPLHVRQAASMRCYGNQTFRNSTDVRRTRKQTCDKAINPSPETKLLSFGYDVMWDTVTSLQKRVLVGRWFFADLPKQNM